MANGWTRFTGGDDMRGAGIVGAIAALLLGMAPVSAQDAGSGLPVTPVERARLDATEAIGQLIFDYDRAAWVATDAMAAAIPAAELPKAGGWVVLPRADGALVVSFYGTRGAKHFVVFEAVTRNGRVIEGHRITDPGDMSLTPIQTRMVDALTVAVRRAGHRPCASSPFNSVVLPPVTEDAPVTVYLLTPQVERRTYPFGGHFRVDVDKHGEIVVDRPFTNSCLALNPEGEGTVGMGITHLLDPVPTEIHVFLSIWMRMPIMVSTTDGRTWVVNGRRIRRVPNGSIDPEI
jgi:hypothetical protein